ncbi:zf-RVT domain-containing protein [Cephalotus follicularis]|uniref:Zf-RVT domain-containing protein n=1 Tax=Cephalotus follicularis TaxID=3775 RepID=A0A1Q3DK95_CEPFO|nr:zf-RVT domain-containing protein [Cephalotus follicularis]
MNLIWDLLSEKPSLWVSWSKAEILRGLSLWQMEKKQGLSVTWKAILRLRLCVSSNLVYSVGLNSSWSLWFDPWLHSMSLVERLGTRAIHDTGLPRDASLSDVIHGSNWSWPSHVWQLWDIRHESSLIRIEQRDRLGWIKPGGPFSFKLAYESIRPSSSIVSWSKVVWSSGGIPKHTFCLWLTFLKAHCTMDKLLRFGVVQSSLCPFGCGQDETVDHLFFDCAFTKTVWSKVMKMNNCRLPTSWNWNDTATWAVEHTVGNHFRFWIRRAGLAASVYHCWRERNNRIFRQSAATTESILARIRSDVADKAALNRSIRDSPANRSIVTNWDITESIFRNPIDELSHEQRYTGSNTRQERQRRRGVG